MLLEFLHQEHQLSATGQAVGALDIEAVKISLSHQITEPVQTGPHQVVPLIAFVDQLLAVAYLILVYPGSQLGQLALNGLLLLLAIGTDPGIHGSPDHSCLLLSGSSLESSLPTLIGAGKSLQISEPQQPPIGHLDGPQSSLCTQPGVVTRCTPYL